MAISEMTDKLGLQSLRNRTVSIWSFNYQDNFLSQYLNFYNLLVLFETGSEHIFLKATGTSLAVQWLRCHSSLQGAWVQALVGETKIPHALQCSQKKPMRDSCLYKNELFKLYFKPVFYISLQHIFCGQVFFLKLQY